MMNLSVIRHRSTGSDCYALDNDTVVLNIWTDYDAERVTVFSEDPFWQAVERTPDWEGKPTGMTKLYELERQVVWTARLKPKYKRLQYYFAVEAQGERYLVFENKICPENERNRISTEYFKFPWLNPSDVIKPPKWVKDVVWYQIFPDRFCRGSDFSGDKKFREWGDFSNPGFNDLYGGNLRGITERLPYLKRMGIGGIYLTPIFLSNTNHKYNTFDYKKIDPDFGTDEDFKELIETAHGLGIRVMIDAVFNHCGTEFFACKDVREKGKASKYYDWFFINSDGFDIRNQSTADGRFYSFAFWAGMPKLNTNNPEVQSYLTDLCLRLTREYHIDGIRFDVGDEISHSFIRRVNSAVKAVDPDIFMLGEIWFDSIGWLNGYEYDSVMNYPFTGSVGDFWRDRKMTSRDFMHRLNFCRALYPTQINEVLFSFLDTHDTPRVRETCESDDELIQKLTVLLTMAGSPCIYYGTEIAMRGMDTPFNRSCMPWEEIESGKYDSLIEILTDLIHTREKLPQLREDEMVYIFDDDNPRLVCYKKRNVTVRINAGKDIAEPVVCGKTVFSHRFSGGKLLPGGVMIEESEK